MTNKLTIGSVVLMLALLCFTVGCKPKVQITDDSKKELSVTISPQQYFLEQIVGDRFSVNCIVPSGGNPENFDMSPSQMVALSKSVAYFKIGQLPIENMLSEKVVTTNPDIKIIDCSVGIAPIADSLAHIDCADNGHGHAAHNGGGDPHIWSSPRTTKAIAKNMLDGVVSIDKQNEAIYSEGYAKLITEINATDSIIKSYLEKAPSKSFIIYHPALSYFAAEYGLHQLSIEVDGKSPTPMQMKALIDKAKAENIRVVFIQREYDAKNAETIAKAISGKAVPIDLSNYEWSKEMIGIARALSE